MRLFLLALSSLIPPVSLFSYSQNQNKKKRKLFEQVLRRLSS